MGAALIFVFLSLAGIVIADGDALHDDCRREIITDRLLFFMLIM